MSQERVATKQTRNTVFVIQSPSLPEDERGRHAISVHHKTRL
jgi:hypothetical protein